MSGRRVVVTGLGAVSPLGTNAASSWSSLLKGMSGIRAMEGAEYEGLPTRLGGKIDREQLQLGNLLKKGDERSMSTATLFAFAAAHEALGHAKWAPEGRKEKERTGVAVGMGMVDLDTICDAHEALKKGHKKVSPLFVPKILPNMAAGHISMRHGFRGPNHTVSTACATGSHAIGDSFNFIRCGMADVMVCGAGEAALSPLAIAGFSRLRALSTNFNERPSEASRPFDTQRDGFVMGEGAAVLVLEEHSHALKRGAEIYAEVLGYGLSGDASHMTAPHEDGQGAFLSMSRALEDAHLLPSQVTYINAHATSTPLGDGIELKAIKRLFGAHSSRLGVSSTKGAHGHLLGAAGNLESLFTVFSCFHGVLPPTLNLHQVCPEGEGLNCVPLVKQDWEAEGRRVALKNSFGFGGTNCTLCIAQYCE